MPLYLVMGASLQLRCGAGGDVSLKEPGLGSPVVACSLQLLCSYQLAVTQSLGGEGPLSVSDRAQMQCTAQCDNLASQLSTGSGASQHTRDAGTLRLNSG